VVDSDSSEDTKKKKKKDKKKKDDSDEESEEDNKKKGSKKAFIGAKEGDERDALEKYLKHLNLDYDTDKKGFILNEKLPKGIDYKLGETNQFKASTNYKKPDTNLDFEALIKNHFENESN